MNDKYPPLSISMAIFVSSTDRPLFSFALSLFGITVIGFYFPLTVHVASSGRKLSDVMMLLCILLGLFQGSTWLLRWSFFRASDSDHMTPCSCLELEPRQCVSSTGWERSA